MTIATVLTPTFPTRPAPRQPSPGQEELWIALREKSFRSVALITLVGSPSDAMVEGITQVASVTDGDSVELIDARKVALGAAAELSRDLNGGPARKVLFVAAPGASAPARLLLGAVDGYVLLIRRGEDRLGAAMRLLEELGPARCLGTALLV